MLCCRWHDGPREECSVDITSGMCYSLRKGIVVRDKESGLMKNKAGELF